MGGKMKKYAATGIVYGNENEFKAIVFRVPLITMVAIHKGGLEFLQKKYDEIKAKLKENEKILNEQYLKELGVKI